MSKRSSSTPILIGAAGFLAWYFWTRAQSLKSLLFIPRGIGIQGSAIALTVGVQNPTPNALQFNGLAGSLYVQGQPIGNVADFVPQLIAPNSETPITLLVTANIFGIAAGVINQLDGNEGSGKFQSSLQGNASVNGISLPVNISFT